METLKNYLLAITAAAIICAIARSLCEEKTVSGSMIRLIAGIVMTVTVLSPVLKLKFDDLPDLSADFTAEAASAAAAGKEMAEAEFNAIIIRQTQAYILDKAAAFGADVEVEILMPADSSWQPDGVIISGSISPYAKERLQKIIAEDIQIPKENQQWIS